jgi:hypothetical protein
MANLEKSYVCQNSDGRCDITAKFGAKKTVICLSVSQLLGGPILYRYAIAHQNLGSVANWLYMLKIYNSEGHVVVTGHCTFFILVLLPNEAPQFRIQYQLETA